MPISLENLEKLEELFEYKNWEVVKDSLYFSSTFNRFCTRLDLFDDEKQKLIIELGYRFLNLGINDFQPYFLDAIKTIPNLENYNSIIVVPLKKPSLQETKSADALWYHLKNFSDFSYEPFGHKLYFTSDWPTVATGIAIPNVLLILIDDFIGTGETVLETLNELYSENYFDETHNVKVVALAAQSDGITNIHNTYNEMVKFGIQLTKGISDNYNEPDLSIKKILMEEIELKLKVHADYEFGYGRSESLFAVSRRSANNTFPVFWLEKKKKLAPFKR